MPENLVMLDTCTVSEGFKKNPKDGFKDWMSAHPNVAIPFPVWTELSYGISKLTDNPILKAQLQIWLDRLRDSEYVMPEMNMEVAVIFGHMMACKPLHHFWMTVPTEKKFQVKSDLLIAAIAIAHDLPLATYDLEDFEKIDGFFKLPELIYPGCREAEVEDSNRASPPAAASRRTRRIRPKTFASGAMSLAYDMPTMR